MNNGGWLTIPLYNYNFFLQLSHLRLTTSTSTLISLSICLLCQCATGFAATVLPEQGGQFALTRDHENRLRDTRKPTQVWVHEKLHVLICIVWLVIWTKTPLSSLFPFPSSLSNAAFSCAAYAVFVSQRNCRDRRSKRCGDTLRRSKFMKRR